MKPEQERIEQQKRFEAKAKADYARRSEAAIFFNREYIPNLRRSRNMTLQQISDVFDMIEALIDEGMTDKEITKEIDGFLDGKK